MIARGGIKINAKVIARIKEAQKRKGVIVLTDPDFAGEKIRKIIANLCKFIFIILNKFYTIFLEILKEASPITNLLYYYHSPGYAKIYTGTLYFLPHVLHSDSELRNTSIIFPLIKPPVSAAIALP